MKPIRFRKFTSADSAGFGLPALAETTGAPPAYETDRPPTPETNGNHRDHETAETAETAETGTVGTVVETAETGTEAGASRLGPVGLPPLSNRPVVPAWLRDPRSTARWAARYGAHITGFHAIRIPGYVFRAAAYTPRGAGRAGTALYRWATDAESAPLVKGSVDRKATVEWLHVDKVRKEKHKVRMPIAFAVVVLALALGYAGFTAPVLRWRLATVAALIGVGGWLGRPVDGSLFDSAVISTPKARKLSADAISQAFAAARLARLPDHPITFFAPVARDGDGWSCVIDLPIGFGRTASDAIAAREKLAAALVVDEGRLFLSRQRGDAGSAGRVSFRLADTDPMTGRPVPSPLVKAAEVDLWKVIPFGIDERGRTVSVSLLWTAMSIAAVPRQGKSFSGRVLLCGAALDPFVDISVFDAKASPDWRMFTTVAERCGFGDDDETAAQLLATLKALLAEMNRRAHAISALPRHLAREGKLTRELARSKRAGMRLKVLTVDECQEYFTHPLYGSEIKAIAEKLVKRGPFVGIITIWLTQKPAADSIPTAIRDNLTSRFGLRVTTTTANEMALGSGAREQGFDATALLPHHKGVGWLVGNCVPDRYSTGGVLVWTHLIDAVAAEAICERGRQLREAHGTLIGQAAGETPDASTASMLADIASAFRAGEADLWNEEIIARIDQAHPGRYSWDSKGFGVAVRSLGLETRQITRRDEGTGKPVNRKGLTLDQVTDALDHHTTTRPTAEPAQEAQGPARDDDL
jgi:S-DNA-T family DNA segregation ATPase FtsK/SpoIIIE